MGACALRLRLRTTCDLELEEVENILPRREVRAEVKKELHCLVLISLTISSPTDSDTLETLHEERAAIKISSGHHDLARRNRMVVD